jgi:tetratricopeptide (TPR) repeat protein
MQAIRKHGNERSALGADLIVEQWIGRTREAGPELARASWSELRALLNDAVLKRQEPLSLRCEEALRHSPDITDAEKALLLKTILQERNLAYASPMMLEVIMEESLAAGDKALALKAAQTVIKDFPETDTVLRARMIASDDALARGAFDEAVKHLTVVREVFASSPQAAEALLKLGELYQQMRKYEDADTAYKEVLGVKAWRPSWPAGLYGRGQNALAQRKYAEAAAYFERIYVLYLGYRPWAAKAYLARADALQKMREYRKAIETLNEMLGLPDFEGMPERGQAEAMLQQLKGNE